MLPVAFSMPLLHLSETSSEISDSCLLLTRHRAPSGAPNVFYIRGYKHVAPLEQRDFAPKERNVYSPDHPNVCRSVGAKCFIAVTTQRLSLRRSEMSVTRLPGLTELPSVQT